MKWLMPLVAIVLTSGCGTMKPDDFADYKPKLDLYEYFSGEIRAWGLFQDRFGRVRRQFQVDIEGRIEDGELVLEEDFVYADGERDRRVWHIQRDGPQGYVGRAADVVGQAQGQAAGNALNWRYDMDLKVGEGTWRVSFDDWMFLQPDGVLMNRAKVKKFGLEIGSVSLFFMKFTPVNESASKTTR